MTAWKELAANHPRTFYGMLAIRTLGGESPYRFEPAPLLYGDVATLLRSGGATRAFALLQIGEEARAESELRRVAGLAGPSALRPLIAIAARTNMPNLAMRLGRELGDIDGRRHDGALYPIPRWQPIGGFEVDPALVYAFMRQESAFNQRAVSRAGARGLMQLMPDTAATLDPALVKRHADGLFDPALNITLGQRYIKRLLENDAVQGDLIRLAAAYNGGPANLARWQRRDTGGETVTDALLFIESLPAPETRHFIARVLYNYWMYAERLGQDSPTLHAIAAGDWPRYQGNVVVARGAPAPGAPAPGAARNARN